MGINGDMCMLCHLHILQQQITWQSAQAIETIATYIKKKHIKKLIQFNIS